MLQALERGAPAARARIKHYPVAHVWLQCLKNAGMDMLAHRQLLVEFRHFPVDQFPEKAVEYISSRCLCLLLRHRTEQLVHKGRKLVWRQLSADRANQRPRSIAQAQGKLAQFHAEAAIQNILHGLLIEHREVFNGKRVLKHGVAHLSAPCSNTVSTFLSYTFLRSRSNVNNCHLSLDCL